MPVFYNEPDPDDDDDDDDEPEIEYFDPSDERVIALTKRYVDLRQILACMITNVPLVKWRDNDVMGGVLSEIDYIAGEIEMPNAFEITQTVYAKNLVWKKN